MVLTYAAYLADNGHEVCLETNKIDTVFAINSKIKIVRITLKGQLGTILYAFFKKRPTDIVIADIIPLAFALRIKYGKKAIYFAQDNNETHYANPFMRLVVIALNYVGLSILDISTITVSNELSRILFKKYNANIEKVIPNGVDLSLFYPEPSTILHAEKKGRKAILILSRSDSRKGFDIAQKVAQKMLASSAVPFEIWTVGEAAVGKFPGIIHRDFGYVPEAALRVILSSADVFLCPSRSEGFGLMVIEAFACKCPVVTTETIPYAVHATNAMVGKIGDINSLADHICQLWSSPKLDRKLRENGYANANEHSQEVAKREFEMTLKDICMRFQEA